MDPLSITASVIACAGAAKGAINGLKKIKRYANASQEIDTLINDLEDVQAFLQENSQLIANGDFNPSTQRYLTQQVLRLGNKIEDLNRLLNPPRHQIAGISEETQSHLSWVKHERKIKSLRRDLVDAKNNVTSALAIVTAASTSGIGRSLNTSIDLQNQYLSNLPGLVDKVNIIQKAVQGFQKPKSPHPRDEEDDRPSNQPSQTITYSDRDEGSNVPCASEGMEVVSRSNAMLTAAGANSPWRLPGLKKCDSWCSCRCHTKTTIVVPRYLRSVIGKTVVEYAGNQQGCNEHSCRGPNKAGLELSYCIPKYLSRQYILVRMSRAPLGNPTVSIRMPRTMDWTHLLWKYAPKGDVRAVQSLFATLKAAPDDTNFQGGTALLLASAHPKLYHFLIQAGADINVADMHGRKPVNLIGERFLSGRVPKEDADSTEELLAETDFMESRQFSMIHKSVLQLSQRVLADELEESTSSINSVDTEGRTPLIWATMRDDMTTIKTLLAFGADPNVRDYAGNTCLHYVRGTEACYALIKAGANVHARNRTRRRTCVHHVCKNTDNPDLIELLHESGAEIDVRDVDAETPLLHAVSCNFTNTADKLIDLGADVNAANDSSRDSVIHIAVAFDHCEILPKLFQRGVDYTATNKHGKTIAHKAAAWATRYTVEHLAILNMADLDLSVKDADGKTAKDHTSERDVLLESEAGIHDSFEQFTTAVENAKVSRPTESVDSRLVESTDSNVGIVRRATDKIRPPGTFPAHG